MNYDTVSRKAERKTIYLDDAMDAIWKDMYADGDYMSAVICDGIEDVLNSLPPVQPEQRWIPVTERLPEDDKDVLIAYRAKDVEDDTGISITSYGGLEATIRIF